MSPALESFLAQLREFTEFDGQDLTVDSVGDLGNTPLHYAVLQNAVGILPELLGRVSDPNVRGEEGYTALHEAAEQDRLECARILLGDPRVDRQVQNANKFTAAQLAALLGHADLLKLFKAEARETGQA